MQIGKTSSLVLTLAGILKNVLLIIVSVMIWHTNISAIQFFGYGIAVFGLLIYSETIKIDHVFAFAGWAKSMWDSPSLDESRLSPPLRRIVFIALGLAFACLLVLGFSWTDNAGAAVDTMAETAAGR